MPTRPTIALILVGWMLAASGLFSRDILPDFWIIPPPDLRSIAVAGEKSIPTRWDLSVADDVGLRSLRPVGHAYTETRRNPDGGTDLISEVAFDSDGLLRGTPFALKLGSVRGEGHLTITNNCAIDPSGNLRQFKVVVKQGGNASVLMTIDAHVVGRSIEMTAQGPIPLLNWTKSIPYEPRGLIQNGIGPTDRLPGLQVGQRWETEVVSPLTGRVEKVLTEVTGKHSIEWGNQGLVPTLEVVQHLSPISARTWVRRDGLVLRQEVPLPFVRLILERSPNPVVDGGKGTNTP